MKTASFSKPKEAMKAINYMKTTMTTGTPVEVMKGMNIIS